MLTKVSYPQFDAVSISFSSLFVVALTVIL